MLGTRPRGGPGHPRGTKGEQDKGRWGPGKVRGPAAPAPPNQPGRPGPEGSSLPARSKGLTGSWLTMRPVGEQGARGRWPRGSSRTEEARERPGSDHSPTSLSSALGHHMATNPREQSHKRLCQPNGVRGRPREAVELQSARPAWCRTCRGARAWYGGGGCGQGHGGWAPGFGRHPTLPQPRGRQGCSPLGPRAWRRTEAYPDGGGVVVGVGSPPRPPSEPSVQGARPQQGQWGSQPPALGGKRRGKSGLGCVGAATGERPSPDTATTRAALSLGSRKRWEPLDSRGEGASDRNSREH